ncbi:sialidase-1 [Parapedobacter composti]|uniref:exo-alpha-sialidase n=2 Tax=Parapedobacter composti TaxID=623281 RepID=A0A1I1K360_9SPHI|nr:sialidase-1 [Parapedobacter composti]
MKQMMINSWITCVWISIGCAGSLSGCSELDTGMVGGPPFERPQVDVSDGEGEDAPELEIIRLFTQGQEGYHSYRIPCLARAVNGNLIAFAEGRKHTSLDYGDIDLVYKISHDNGEHWSALRIVVDEGEGTWGNPTAVTDEDTGRIWLFLSWNSDSHSQHGGSFGGRDYAAIDSWGQRRVFTSHSDDHGETWSTPVDRTEVLLPPGYTWDAMGPGIGIQVKHGPDAGRLIIPAGGRNIYSDDNGLTWKYQVIPEGTFEGTVVELASGLLMRNDRPVLSRWTSNRARYVSRGTISGGFSAFTADANLPDPRCQASILRYSWSPNRIVFLNAANDEGDGMPFRCRMTVRISDDDGETWSTSRQLYPDLAPSETCEQGFGGYSSLITTADGHIGALVEHNSGPTAGTAMNRRHSIDFHKFNLAWIKEDGGQE